MREDITAAFQDAQSSLSGMLEDHIATCRAELALKLDRSPEALEEMGMVSQQVHHSYSCAH